MNPFKIAGAGPAGLTAAITLARAGHSIVVYERAGNVGSRHHGDLECMENWTTPDDLTVEFASWGLSQNYMCLPFYSLTGYGPRFQSRVVLQDARPLFFVIMRGPSDHTLDRGLLAQARTLGVQIEFNCTAPTNVDIIATGLSKTRAFGVGYNFQTSMPNACYVCLDDELTPKGYSYLIFANGHGSICATAISGQKGMREKLERAVVGFQAAVGFDMKDAKYFAAPVTFGLPQSGYRAGSLIIGEAAEFQDPLAGFGLRMSMKSGYLAARSILDGDNYDSLWRSSFEPLMRASAVHRMFHQWLGNRGYPIALTYIRTFSKMGRTFLSKHYRPQWYTRLFWPMAKRRLEMECRRTKSES